MLSMAIYLRPTDPNESLLGGMEWHDIARYSFEIGTVCGVLSYIIIQQGGEMLNQGACSFIKQLVNIFDGKFFHDFNPQNNFTFESFQISAQRASKNNFFNIQYFNPGLHSISVSW